MDDDTVTPSGPAEHDELRATVAQLRAEVAELRALVTTATPTTATPSADAELDPSVSRRSAIRRVGTLAAGAVVGGAGIVAATAQPAAAATISGSGSPGVSATGVGGDGVSANTNHACSSGVYGVTNVSSAYGVFANHGGGGHALGAASDGAQSTLFVQNAGVGAAASLVAQGVGLTARGGTIGAFIGGGDVSIRLTPISHPVTGTNPIYLPGDVAFDGVDLWATISRNSTAVFRKIVGRDTAGAFHVLAAPVRAYDSRSGTSGPGPKTPLVANTARTLDLTVGATGAPAGATAVLLTVLLVNAVAGNGNIIVWANGVAAPAANTLVWGPSGGRFTATAVSAVDSAAKVQVRATLETDIVVDVVGYYR